MEDQEQKIDIDEKYFGAEEICRALRKISKPTLRTWVDEGMPQLKRGKYPLFACLEWAWKNKWDTDDTSLAEERKRKLAAEASLKEWELALKEGRVILRDEVLAEFMNRIHAVKTGLLSLPRMVAQLLVGKTEREIMEILKKAIEEILERFSRKGGVLK